MLATEFAHAHEKVRCRPLKNVCPIIGLSVILIFSLTLLAQLKSNIQIPEWAQIFWKENSLSSYTIEHMRAQEPNLILQAYANSQKKKVRMPGLKRQVETKWVALYPSSQDTINKELIEGGYILNEKECIVDEDIAQALFGSYKIVGEEIWLEGNPFIIAGVVKGEEQAIYYEGPEDQLYSTLIVDFKEALNTKQQIESFLMAYNLPSPVAVVYTDEWRFITDIFINLPMVILIGIVLIGTMRGIRQEEDLKSIKGLMIQLILIGLAIGFCIYLFKEDIPQSLIPSKWSDPTFYTLLWGRFKNDLLTLPTLGENVGVKVLLDSYLRLVGTNILNLIICLEIGRYLYRRTNKVRVIEDLNNQRN